MQGRVQGVFFRVIARDAARGLGLVGWVRNQPDGAVEAVCEGAPQAVTSFIAWCHDGPEYARVSDVAVAEEDVAGPFTGFSIR